MKECINKKEKLINHINELKNQKNAIILAHNYQPREIQEIADFIGDSLELCIIAEKTEADIIVFCGVDFMAETAKILNPTKKVLLPEIVDSECPMAHQLPPEVIIQAKKEHPDAKVVIYVNTLASAKAMADATCTSANADKVVNLFEEDKILFGPDNNLAYFVEKRTDKKIIPVPKGGHCYVHKMYTLEDAKKVKAEYPDAELLIHPESNPELQDIADYVMSTGGMVKHVLNSPVETFIIGTECDMISRLNIELEKVGKSKNLVPLRSDAICKSMKNITLEKIETCLIEEKYEVNLDKEIIEKAKVAIDKMLSLNK
ncbi:quinolinate synthase NadA [Methanococcus voltae]|uniref:Quinolinate synthase n=2 Tax=Methanococcus voltae TaxID=2188 RepID=A0A8J7RD26_METVO|nr:quinolinate synthase NadA [Methanococcus voltae]MBP2172043.1 quinolinate synthase [Methanococcus voltae]MBP2201002.1 quinolinate synthase [Methanococcus voltae]MCS3921724.1 quinolinate synthase [Methanococcus voltae PS]